MGYTTWQRTAEYREFGPPAMSENIIFGLVGDIILENIGPLVNSFFKLLKASICSCVGSNFVNFADVRGVSTGTCFKTENPQ